MFIPSGNTRSDETRQPIHDITNVPKLGHVCVLHSEGSTFVSGDEGWMVPPSSSDIAMPPPDCQFADKTFDHVSYVADSRAPYYSLALTERKLRDCTVNFILLEVTLFRDKTLKRS